MNTNVTLLLETIDENTKNGKKRPIQTITSADELLVMAQVSDSKSEPVIRCRRERYRRNLFTTILEDLYFFYRQWRDAVETGDESERSARLKQRVDSLLDALEADLENYKDLLFQKLETETGHHLSTVAFILASVETEKPNSPFLNRLLEVFRTCSDKNRSFFKSGLESGRHSALRQYLQDIVSDNNR